MAKEERIGNPYKSLVLRTSGPIRVLVGDKYYTLNYNKTEDDEKEESNESNKDFIISESPIDDYKNGTIPYPGDNVIIFIPGDNIYYTINNDYFPFNVSTEPSVDTPIISKTFEDTVRFLNKTPFTVESNQLIRNLNTQYLNGYTASDFIKKGDTMTFKTIKTSDERFIVTDGNMTIENVNATNINTKFLNAVNIVNSINIGNTIVVYDSFESLIGKYCSYTTNYTYNILDEYLKNNIDTTENFFSLSKKLFEIVNSTYNWEIVDNNYISSILDSGIIFKVINIDTWKQIKLLDTGLSLYDKYLTGLYTGSIDTKYDGALFTVSTTAGNAYPGDIVQFTTEERISHEGIVTYTTDNYLEIKSNVQSNIWVNSTEKEIPIEIKDIDNNTILSYTVKLYESLEEEKYYIDSITSNSGVIGSVHNINDTIFGKLTGYGIYSINDSTFINPNIAISNNNNCYIKLSKNDSYLGKNGNDPWIKITDTVSSITTPSYSITSDGSIKTDNFTINPDGTITIGDVTGKLQVESDGTIKIV